MGLVLVLVQRRGADGAVCRSTRALLTIARRLGAPVAVLCGTVDAASIALLGRFGARTVCTVDFPELAEHPAAASVETLVHLARRMSPTAILIAAGRAGHEVAARLAVRLDSGIVSDAVDLRTGPQGPIAVQSVLAGSYRVESSVVRGTPVFTVRAEAVAPEAAPVVATVHHVGMRFPGHVRADALGGAVGGSHTATELGWCPREAMIDQVGRVIHPRLYLALGISGSVRHRAGMQGAGTIVAIDRDPAAPIFRVADLGIVGDLHEVVPELLAEIRRRKAQPLVPEV